MRTTRIYVLEALSENTPFSLTGNAANHVANVLRLRIGDDIVLFNGNGGEYAANILEITKRQVTVQVLTQSKDDRESPLQIHLIQAVARGEKMDWIIQKATELGVHKITPLLTERSGVKLSPDRWEKRHQHWQAVAISACEQCGRNRLPEIAQIINYPSLLEQPQPGTSLILAPDALQPLTVNMPLNSPQINLFIGPEGGFSEQELQQAEIHGLTAVKLGPRVLRTETAAITSVSIIQALFGDLC